MVKELLDHIQILFSSIYLTVSKIETSLTFCKVNILHPSIINTPTLLDELSKLESHFPNQFLYPIQSKYVNAIEQLVTTQCIIHNSEIIYSLTIPLYNETSFTLFKLYPVPTIVRNETVIIIPQFQYILKNKDSVLFTNNKCILHTYKKYSCQASDIVLHHQDHCLSSLIVSHPSSSCEYTRLASHINRLDFIPDTNYLVISFFQPDQIQIQRREETVTHHLQGIYLLYLENITIIYKHHTYVSTSTVHSSISLFHNTNITLEPYNFNNLTLHLKNIPYHNLHKTQFTHYVTPFTDNNEHFTHHLLLWLFLCIIFTLCIIFFVNYRTNLCKIPNRIPSPSQPIQFNPGQATILLTSSQPPEIPL